MHPDRPSAGTGSTKRRVVGREVTASGFERRKGPTETLMLMERGRIGFSFG